MEWQFRSHRKQRSTKADCPTKNAVGFFDDVGGKKHRNSCPASRTALCSQGASDVIRSSSGTLADAASSSSNPSRLPQSALTEECEDRGRDISSPPEALYTARMTKRLVDIDDDLLAAAIEVLGASTMKEAVNRSLTEVVRAARRVEHADRLAALEDLDLADTEVMSQAWR